MPDFYALHLCYGIILSGLENTAFYPIIPGMFYLSPCNLADKTQYNN
jgi:hypothetical protein